MFRLPTTLDHDHSSIFVKTAVGLAAQFGLAIFEATFALYAQAKFNYGPIEVGAVFVVCGLVMTIFQIGARSVFP